MHHWTAAVLAATAPAMSHVTSMGTATGSKSAALGSVMGGGVDLGLGRAAFHRQSSVNPSVEGLHPVADPGCVLEIMPTAVVLDDQVNINTREMFGLEHLDFHPNPLYYQSVSA